MQKETLTQEGIVLAEVRNKLSKIALGILRSREPEDVLISKLIEKLNKLIEELDELNGSLRFFISRGLKESIRGIRNRLSDIIWGCEWYHPPLEIAKSLNELIIYLDKLFGGCIRKSLMEEKKRQKALEKEKTKKA